MTQHLPILAAQSARQRSHFSPSSFSDIFAILSKWEYPSLANQGFGYHYNSPKKR